MQGSTPSLPPPVRIGPYVIDPARNSVTGPEGEIHAEPKVIDLALALQSRRGEVVSRDALIELVWDGAFGADESLNVTISRLRKVLHDTDHHLIETVPKRGYRLCDDPAEGPGDMTPAGADPPSSTATAAGLPPRHQFAELVRYLTRKFFPTSGRR